MFYTHFHSAGNTIYLRYVDERGRRRMKEIKDYSPILYIKTKQKTEFRNLREEHLAPVAMGSISEAKDYIEEYKDVSGFSIYGNTNWAYAYINEAFPGKVKYDLSKIRSLFYDIETEIGDSFPDPDLAMERINVMSFFDGEFVKVFCLKGYRPGSVTHEFPVEICEYETETELLKEFLTWWTIDYPDVVTGWHIDGFDTPYIVNRIRRVLGENTAKRLSPYGKLIEKKIDGDRKSYTVLGVAFIDYLDLFKKYMLGSRESYKLDDICETELGQKKLDYSEYPTLKEFYTKNFPKFVDYNILDTVLVYKLDKKLNLLTLQINVAYLAKVNFPDPFSPVRTWDIFIQNSMYDMKIFADASWRPTGDTRTIVGGYVMEPEKGRYKWPISFDATSLYPSIIRSWNISPETKLREFEIPQELQEYSNGEFSVEEAGKLTELLKEHNLCMAANGVFYRRDKQGIMPMLCERVFNDRAAAKKEMLAKKRELEKLEAEIERLSN